MRWSGSDMGGVEVAGAQDVNTLAIVIHVCSIFCMVAQDRRWWTRTTKGSSQKAC